MVVLTSLVTIASAQAQSAPPNATPVLGPASCGPAAGGGTCAGASGVASQGNAGGADIGVGNPINLITGNKYQREVDLAPLPGRLGLEIIRHYNSTYSNPDTTTGILGRGWKLSYETDLYRIGSTIQIVQADGSRIIFNRDPAHPQVCSTTNPAEGQLRIARTAAGENYVWTWTSGRTLSFDAAGKLVQIALPTGEFISLQHDPRGMLVQVTDPQGRKLHLRYADARDAGAGFRGVVAISSPVGSFDYAYGSTAPARAIPTRALQAPNLVRVGYPQAGAGRQYHYEDPRHPSYLTGITAVGADLPARRISTYLYDAQGRAVLSVRGLPARLQTAPDGTPLQPARLVEGTGIGQVTLDYSTPGMTLLANSLGQKTTYRHGIVGGQFRLLEVRGAGCASCGEMNLRYGYDPLGRQTSMTRLTTDGQPIRQLQTVLDNDGRPLRISAIDYVNGKAIAPRLQARYDYAPGAAAMPILIARPSVVPGQEHRISIAYAETQDGPRLPMTISETGHVPTMDGKASASVISRTLRYRYDARGQRIEQDGPLQNATASPGPDNSDISRTEYDARTGLLTRTIAPGGVVTEIRERDAALRPILLRSTDGAVARTIRITRNWRGQPEEIRIEAGMVTRAVEIKPTQVTDRFATDPSTRMVRSTRYRYDSLGNLLEIIQPGNRSTRFGYDGAGRLSQRILPDGITSITQQDTEGHVGKQSEYAGETLTPETLLASIAFQYDDAGRLSHSDDAFGLRSRQRYDRSGQLAEIENALGTISRLTVDVDGLLAARTDAAGTTDAATSRFGHDALGQSILNTDANGVGTQIRHDDFGRKVAEISPDRGVTLYRHDAAGRLIARIDESQTTTRYTYDNANRLIAMGADRQADLVQYRYVGQQLKEVITTTDGKPEHATQTTTYETDALGRVTQERQWIDRLEGETGSVSGNNRTPVFPLAGHAFVTRSVYDAADRLVRQVLPDGHTLRWRYAAVDSSKTGSLHGAVDQPETILFDQQIIATDIQHAGGRLTGYTTGNGILQKITRDGRGRIDSVEAVTAPARVAAKVAAHSRHPGTVVYRQVNRYDAADRLTGIERQHGAPISGQAAPTNVSAYGYDRLDRLASIREGAPDTTTIAYDPGGNRIHEALPRQTFPSPAADSKTVRTYRYAAGTNRLIGVTNGSTSMPARAAGVPVVLQADTAPATASDAARLIQSLWLYHPTGVPLARFDFATRNAGVAAVSDSQRIVYNSAQRPIAVFDGADGLVAAYRYNGEGERIAKTLFTRDSVQDGRKNSLPTVAGTVEHPAGRTVYSLYSNQRLAAETDGAGQITAHYIYLDGRPIAKVEMQARTGLLRAVWKTLQTATGWGANGPDDQFDATANIYAVHADHRGAPQVVTDERQNVVWQADTDAFGNATVRYPNSALHTVKSFEMNLRLPGQIYDAETGQHYNYQRSYDPQLGRYTTPDPIGLDGGSNPYAYVSNNPLTNVDSLGLYEEDVHYYMTYFLAITAGLSEKQAWVIATADRYIDDNPNTEPFGIKGKNLFARSYYHFTQFGHDTRHIFGEDDTVYAARRYLDPDNPQIKLLRGYALDSTNTPCSKSQLYGEFLHAFQDTFAHRNQNNSPYANLIGHISGGHSPDKTFNHMISLSDLSAETLPTALGNWGYNGAKTLAMEEATFKALKNDYGLVGKDKNGFPIEWEDLKSTLIAFNSDPVSKALEITSLQALAKAEVLQTKLTELGYEKMRIYDCNVGRDQRNANLTDKTGVALSQSQRPGTILATPSHLRACK